VATGLDVLATSATEALQPSELPPAPASRIIARWRGAIAADRGRAGLPFSAKNAAIEVVALLDCCGIDPSSIVVRFPMPRALEISAAANRLDYLAALTKIVSIRRTAVLLRVRSAKLLIFVAATRPHHQLVAWVQPRLLASGDVTK
jgi:hypothetical protein